MKLYHKWDKLFKNYDYVYNRESHINGVSLAVNTIKTSFGKTFLKRRMNTADIAIDEKQIVNKPTGFKKG